MRVPCYHTLCRWREAMRVGSPRRPRVGRGALAEESGEAPGEMEEQESVLGGEGSLSQGRGCTVQCCGVREKTKRSTGFVSWCLRD